MKRSRRKIPRKAVEALMYMCEDISERRKEPAGKLFREYLELMMKYDDYFFSDPWPEKYVYDDATTFTDEDLEFLTECDDDFKERFEVLCLKKNINLEIGFMGIFGRFWTWQAFHEEFVRPGYKPVLEQFDVLAEENIDSEAVLTQLKQQFKDVKLIHNSLIDFIEHGYTPRKKKKVLTAELLELIHTQEGLPECNDYRCKDIRKRLQEGDL